MFKISEKFVKNIEKFNDYFILRKEEDHLIIGTMITIERKEERMGSVFQDPHEVTVEKYLPVFFLLTAAKRAAPIDKLFIKNNLPFISFNKQRSNISSEVTKEILDEFVIQNFCD